MAASPRNAPTAPKSSPQWIRARVAPDGAVRWTETCFCATPLRHERATVLDRYFTEIETRVIDKPVTFDGAPLMDQLLARWIPRPLTVAAAPKDTKDDGGGRAAMSEANDILTIDVVSDVVCPWCYLGEKRLEMALAEAPQPVALRWRPYQLDPTIPDGGLDRAEYMAKKFGKSGKLQTAHDNLTRLGAEVGIPFAFDKIKRAPNTLDAHRLIRWANSAGVQGKVVDRLFKAYFVEGRDIGDRDVLIDIAGECGLDARLVEKLLAEGADADLVREEIAQAQAIGVSGVPFFIFAGRLGVPGAQDPSVLLRAMAQARQAMNEPIGEATVQ